MTVTPDRAQASLPENTQLVDQGYPIKPLTHLYYSVKPLPMREKSAEKHIQIKINKIIVRL